MGEDLKKRKRMHEFYAFIQVIASYLMQGEFKHEVRQFEKSYDNQQAEQISLMV